MFFFFCGPPPSPFPFPLPPPPPLLIRSFILSAMLFFSFAVSFFSRTNFTCWQSAACFVLHVLVLALWGCTASMYMSLCVCVWCAGVLLAGLVIFFFRVLLLDFVGLCPSSLFGCIAFLFFFCVVFRSRVQTEPTRTRARASGVQHRRHRGSCPCRSAWSSRQCVASSCPFFFFFVLGVSPRMRRRRKTRRH